MQKRLSALFVALCLVLCAVPSVGMAVRPTTEPIGNERTTALPALKTQDGTLNLRFFPELGDWFEKHFAFRAELMTADAAIEAGFSEALLTGHIGKFVKLSGGILNTHSKLGDHRAELMAEAARAAGADDQTAKAMFDCVTTDEMLRILEEKGMLNDTMQALKCRIDGALNRVYGAQIALGVIVFTTGNRTLLCNAHAKQWMEERI